MTRRKTTTQIKGMAKGYLLLMIEADDWTRVSLLRPIHSIYSELDAKIKSGNIVDPISADLFVDNRKYDGELLCNFKDSINDKNKSEYNELIMRELTAFISKQINNNRISKKPSIKQLEESINKLLK